MRNLDWPIITRYITNTYFLLFKCFTAIGYTSICCPMRFKSPVAIFLICITLGKNQWNRELAGWMDLKHYHHFFPSLQHTLGVVPQIPFKLTHWMQHLEMFAILTSNCYKYLFYKDHTNKLEIRPLFSNEIIINNSEMKKNGANFTLWEYYTFCNCSSCYAFLWSVANAILAY